MVLRSALLAVVVTCLSGCGGEAESDRRPAASTPVPSSTVPNEPMPAPETIQSPDGPAAPSSIDPKVTSKVQNLEVDDVWVFSHSYSDGADALLTGEASIDDGCLRIAGTVVIWHESRLAEAREAVAAVQAGVPSPHRMGGGEANAEVARLLGIADRCNVDNVWFSSPATP